MATTTTPAEKLARSLLTVYGHERLFEVKLADKDQADSVGKALEELGCKVRQEDLTLAVLCADR
jgi:hypothetical protein